MDVRINIDLEKINELNGDSTPFFKYLKDVSKNKTPIILKGVKNEGYWDCTLYECAIPASRLSFVKLPADEDENPVGTTTYISLTTKILSMMESGTVFEFKEKKIVMKIGSFRAEDSYTSSVSEVEGQLGEFLTVLESDNEEPVIEWDIDKQSIAVDYLSNMASTPEASMFLGNSITFRDDTFFFRTPNNETFKTDGSELYVNMYMANKILQYLDYCDTVKIKVGANLQIVGYIGENEVVRNVSVVYDAPDENPSDEDLASITPDESTSTSVEVDLNELFTTFDTVGSKIQTFIETRNYEVKLLKNGEGVSFEMSTGSDDATTSKVVVNVGNVEEESPSDDKFTSFAIALPLRSICNIVKGNQVLTFMYDENVDNAVALRSGNVQMLSGKLL